MSDTSLFVCREEGIRRGFFCKKKTRLVTTSVTAESARCFGEWSAVFGSDKDVMSIATAVGYKRRRRKCFFASL